MTLNMSILLCAIAKKHGKTLTKYAGLISYLISCFVTSCTSLEVVCLQPM